MQPRGNAAKDCSIVRFQGGRSFVGTDAPEIPFDGEGPRRPIRLSPFGIDRYAVSNRRFGTFVAETGYLTDAERFGWSFVFEHFVLPERKNAPHAAEAPWWRKIQGAFWAAPEGPGSSVTGKDQHPVVHISWNDAIAFAQWCGGRLPSEVEWEHAARGGAENRRFPWGNDEPLEGKDAPCNIWQGQFPHFNNRPEARVGTVPVDALAPNPAGLYNCSGNVWEWCADAFRVHSLNRAAQKRNRESASGDEKVMKGGSYLCHRSYCYRYRIAARAGRSPDTSTGHAGFRVAFD
jgi:formylglycine-generating enzyme required for sulfatase activity